MLSANSSALRGPERGAERVLQLDVVDAVVAADHDQQQPAVLDHHGIGLQQRARRHLEAARDVGDGDQAGRLDELGRGEPAGSSTGCASAVATSTLAA